MSFIKAKQAGIVLDLGAVVTGQVVTTGDQLATVKVLIGSPTADATLTLPVPTDTEVQVLTVTNRGTANIVIYSLTLLPNQSGQIVYYNGSWS